MKKEDFDGIPSRHRSISLSQWEVQWLWSFVQNSCDAHALTESERIKMRHLEKKLERATK